MIQALTSFITRKIKIKTNDITRKKVNFGKPKFVYPCSYNYPFVRSMYNFKLHGVKKKHERKLTSATNNKKGS